MAKNGKNLVIVESPAKAKTINKYLGDDYIVKASMGHIRDLPSSGMGVDLVTFEPNYVVIDERGKGKLVTELRKLAKASEHVYLATDLDREGEAIAWHLKEALGVPDAKARRVIFNAITKSEIQKAFKNHTHIDIDRVNAQQARRILDRIVGYEISPLLWRKVAGCLRRPGAERDGSPGGRAGARNRRVHPRRVLEDWYDFLGQRRRRWMREVSRRLASFSYPHWQWRANQTGARTLAQRTGCVRGRTGLAGRQKVRCQECVRRPRAIRTGICASSRWISQRRSKPSGRCLRRRA